MTTPADRRSERTRQAIRSAFVTLLVERGYSRLTVAQVIERANVGRSTFYEHFRTKHDLLTQSLAGPFGILAACIGAPAPPPGLRPLLAHFREMQALGRGLFLPPTQRLMSAALADAVAARLAVVASPKISPILPLRLIAEQLAATQLCLVETWSLGKMFLHAEQVERALHDGSNALADALLRMPEEARKARARLPTPHSE